jgi:intraflagellar transport protein 140
MIGMVSCWVADGRSKPVSTFSNASQHSAPITIIKWSPSGKRLITGDKRGLVCIWTVDARGTMSPIRQYKRKGAITTIAFCLLPLRPENINPLRSKQEKTATPPFFFGTDQGSLVYADDLGHCADVQQLPSSIDVMLYFEEKSRLIIITRSLLLTQYQVAEDGRVSRAGQVKLSITGDVMENGLKFVVWAAPGVIAMASHEKFIRLLDVATDENYNLSLSAAGDMIPRNDRVLSVAFNRNERYLAVGTKMGAILVSHPANFLSDIMSPLSSCNFCRYGSLLVRLETSAKRIKRS